MNKPGFYNYLFLAITSLPLYSGQQIFAAEYSLQPSVRAAGSYNDNVNLAPKDGDEISGYSITPAFTFRRDTQDAALTLQATAPFHRNSLGRYDSDDQTASLSYLRRAERGSVSVTGSLQRESTRTLDDQDSDAGFRQTEATRANAESIVFSGNYAITDKDTLQGSISGQQRRYRSNRQRGYDYFSANGLWQHNLSERLILQTQAGYSKYLPDDLVSVTFSQALFDTAVIKNVTGQALTGRLEACLSGGTSIIGIPNNDNLDPNNVFAPCFEVATRKTEQGSVNAKLGLIYAFSEKIKLDVLVGGTETGTKRDELSVEKRGIILDRDKIHTTAYEAALSYNGERLRSSLHGSRKNETTSTGSLQLADRIEWKTNWKATTHDSLAVDFIWFQRKEDSQESIVTTTDREHRIARVQYTHRFNEDWSGRIRYQYRANIVESSINDAERNEVLLSISWSPTRLLWSR